MSKYKFKKGDKVRVIADSYRAIKIGSVGIVQENSNCPYVMFNKSCFTKKASPQPEGEEDTYALKDSELELVPEKPKKQTPPRITLKKHEAVVSELKAELEKVTAKLEKANTIIAKRDDRIEEMDNQYESLKSHADEILLSGGQTQLENNSLKKDVERLEEKLKGKEQHILLLTSEVETLEDTRNNWRMFFAVLSLVSLAVIVISKIL